MIRAVTPTEIARGVFYARHNWGIRRAKREVEGRIGQGILNAHGEGRRRMMKGGGKVSCSGRVDG